MSAAAAAAASAGEDAPRSAAELLRRARDRTPAIEEFLAGEERIVIVPNFEEEALPLLTGTVGPFDAVTPTEVPLWFALVLKDSGRCQIRCPAWMKLSALREALEAERSERLLAGVLPAHFAEVAALLLARASDNVSSSDECRAVLDEIATLRSNKLADDMKGMKNASGVCLSNIAHAELNNVRSLLSDGLAHAAALEPQEDSQLATQQ